MVSQQQINLEKEVLGLFLRYALGFSFEIQRLLEMDEQEVDFTGLINNFYRENYMTIKKWP